MGYADWWSSLDASTDHTITPYIDNPSPGDNDKNRYRNYILSAPTTTRTITLPANPGRGPAVRFSLVTGSPLAAWVIEVDGGGEIARITAGSDGGWVEVTPMGATWVCTAWGGQGSITI